MPVNSSSPRHSRSAPAQAPSVRRLPVYVAGDITLPVRVFGNDERIAEDTIWTEHAHPTHELLWHESGVGSVTIGARTWTLAPSVGLWIPAGTLHSGWTPAGVWQRAAHLSVSTTALADTAVAVEITPLLRLLLDRLISVSLSPASYSSTEAMILDVLQPSDHDLLLYRPQNPLLAPILAAFESDPADSTSLTAWADKLGVSTRTITRAFETETGLTFSRWIATAKAQHALERMGQGMTIDEVAGEVGYRSASAFTTAFRRVTGTTPGQFRNTKQH